MSKQKKRIMLSITVIAAAIAVCIIYAAAVISKDAETGNIIIKHNLFSDYTYEICDDHIKLILYKETNEKTVTIPDTIMGKPVTEIGIYCFSTSAPKELMAYDRKFETVELGKNVEIIGESAFKGCESLKEVLGDVEISNVGKYAFKGCESLYKVEFKMSRVENHAFAACVSLHEINMDSRITYIGSGAFSPCRQLTDIGKQDNLEYVGDMAFWGAGIEKFEASEDTEFGFSVFLSTPFRDNVSELILNTLLIKCGYDNKMPYILVQNGITSMDSGCVCGDISNLEEIYISDSVTEIKGYVCDAKDVKVDFYIPDSVISIGHDYDDGTHVGIDDDAKKIVTTEGSYAQEYAKKYNIPCEIVDHIEMPEE